MPANVGSIDRTARLILGLAIIVAAFVPALPLASNPLSQWGAVGVGVIVLVTAIARFCPLYTIFGLSTCKVSNR